MNVGFYILTYNRPSILTNSLYTLFNNTEVKPSEVWILDDGSEPKVKSALLNYSSNNPESYSVNLLIHGKNHGIGYAFERVYNLIRQNYDIELACIIESDYIWRKGWLEDCISVFEASPYTLAIAGTDHPDMYDRQKTHGTFPEIMKECYGKDLESREHLYVPFDLETKNGTIKVQGVSNSCGCMIINWKRLKQVLKDTGQEEDFWKRMDRAFNKGVTHDTRKNASDGHMSSTISMIGELNVLESIGAKLNKDFPMLSICDYSISEHVCGGGVNGLIVQEGSTFIHSPKWDKSFLSENPRKQTDN